MKAEMRPCHVGKEKRKAVFHRWVDVSQIVPPSITVGGHGGGVVRDVFALVEFEDGSVREVEPSSIVFIHPNCFVDMERLFEKKENAE